MRMLMALATVTFLNAASPELLKVADVEKVGAQTGLHAVPKNQSTGAGGELNFAGADNKLVLMVMIQPLSTFDFWKKQYGAKGEVATGVGNEAFRSKKGEFISYVFFRKGNTGVWLQSMGWKKGGAANFTAAQLEQLARLAADRM